MKQPSMVGRAISAIVLMVGFYVLALSVAAALLWLIYAQVALLGRVSLKLSLLFLLLAGTILWSIVPRPDRFEPPGPRLEPDENPELFAALRDVAELTRQQMPAEVYLVNDMNAFVTQRGGVMGFFSKRVMGLGLPLLQVLTVSQLRAVIAHEFGHFHGGDTRVGPFIYKTRGAIGRTIISLGDSIIHKPFEWYGQMFMKITQAISRRQELAADALAARVVGAPHLIDGLKAVHGGGLAFGAYWQNEYMPAVASGFMPPLAHGFATFMQSEDLASKLDDAVERELESDEEDPYDTHPPLPRRIEALEAWGDEVVEDDERMAIALLSDGPQLERELLGSVIVPEHMQTLVGIAWEDTADQIYAPQWRNLTAEMAEHLAGFSPRKLPATPKKMAAWAIEMTGENPDEVSVDAAAHFAAERFGVAIATALLKRDWTVRGSVGEPFVFEKDDHQLVLFRDLHALADRELAPSDWRTRLEEMGIDRMRLTPKKTET